MEIAYLPPGKQNGKVSESSETDAPTSAKNYFFPGIFLASTVSRFVRPVQNLSMGGVEWIGPLE